MPPLAATLEPLKSWKRDPAGVRYDPVQFELLKSGVPKWNRMRKAEPSVAVTLDGVDLDNRMLSGADLQGARFVGASLKSADLSMARLQKANLRRADLRSANLEKADLRQADLRGATLWRASVGRAKFDGATVSSSTITHTGKPATQAWADELGALFDTVGQVSE
ncbi:MAG: pentapeptide repeat-containing protein [Chlorobiaceae bacterium]|nr:pentapeptide repeat-containing protein [Chlorobiaceae bacterium]